MQLFVTIKDAILSLTEQITQLRVSKRNCTRIYTAIVLKCTNIETDIAHMYNVQMYT